MEPQDYEDDRDDFPNYRAPKEIAQSELSDALNTLNLFCDDLYLRMQAFNLAIVDKFIMQLEADVLRKLHDEEQTSGSEAIFLSAQSQMWIFACYELLRTWREKAKAVVEWSKNGGLKTKIDALETQPGYFHVGRKMQADQLRRVSENPLTIEKIRDDLRVSHIPFVRIEHIRIALAKHQVRKRPKSIAYAPGIGRINQWCGSIEYELENGVMIMGNICRRDIADELRGIADRSDLPTDEDLASFDKFMNSVPENPFKEMDDSDTCV